MRQKFFLLAFICLLLSSCYNKPIIYEYNHVFITRFNKGSDIYFYYGKYEAGNYPPKYVHAYYHGFNSGIQAYLTFEKDGKVYIRDVMGYFDIIGKEQNIKIVYSDNTEFNPWFDSISNNYNNTFEVSDALNIEKEKNLENHSKVKAIYY